MIYLAALVISVVGSVDPNTGPAPAPPPTPGPVARNGLLDRQTVRHYIRLQQPAVRHCYVLELGRQPKLRTRVTLELSIDGTGRVTRCSFGDTDLDRCVARAVCSIRFPYVYDAMVNGQRQVSLGTTDVRYSFRFQPRDKNRKRHASADQNGERRIPSSRPAAPETASKRVKRPQPTTTTPPLLRPSPSPAPRRSKPSLPRIKKPRGEDPLEGLDLENPL
jgi:ferredoxin